MKFTPKDQLLCGRWRNATCTCMGRCGLSVFPSRPIISAMWWHRLASCVMHDYLWTCVFLSSYYLFTFSPFHLSFPCPSKRPTARWQLTKWLTPVDGLLQVDFYLEQAHYLAHQTSSSHLFASCHWYLSIKPINPCQPNNDSFVSLLMVLAIRQLNYAIQF